MRNVFLGGFRLTELLGSGGMGTVWRGVYEGPGADLLPGPQRSRVALKVLTSVRSPQQAWLSAFASEVRSIARLNHPNILTVFDFGEVSEDAMACSQGEITVGSPWLAMELADQGSLSSQSQGMTWADLRRVLISLMQALGNAHAHGLVHRDVKPANILFGENDVLKLADFGIAVDVRGPGQVGLEGYAVGTPNYMAPEQFEGQTSQLGPWTDLYAVGCMVYRLVCGRFPYAADGFLGLREAHCTWPVPVMTPTISVPAGLDTWVETLMAKNPHTRFSCVADARAALESLGEAESWGAVEPLSSAETISSGGPALASPLQPSPPALSTEDWPTPVVPSDWRRSDRPEWHGFRGVGLALHGVRTLPFVGRDALRDALWGLLEEVAASCEPSAVVLEGPAGVGKSRLARWLAQRAQELGAAEYMVATHDEDGGPGTGISAMLTRGLGLRGASVRVAQDRLAQRWYGRLDSDALEALCAALVGEGGRLETERRALWRMTLEMASHQRPIVVLLEDVVWDLESVQFVRWVLDQAPIPVLFLLTVRSEDLAESLGIGPALVDLASHPKGQRFAVAPLEAAEASRLVGEGLGLRGDLAAQVRDRTAGNPLFAVQVVGDWVAKGLLVPDAEGFHLAPGATVQLPDDLHAIWSGRIGALLADRPDEEGRALEIAAVLGSVVDPLEWQQACAALGVARGTVLEGMLLRGLAQQAPAESAWSFVHGMAREALLRRARDGGRWESAHRVCASVLRELGGQESRIGRHLLEAGQPMEALEPLMEGMNAHLARGELAQAQVAMEHQRRALASTPPDDSRRMWATLQRARLARLGGRIRAAEEETNRARTLAKGLGDVAGQAHVCTEEALTAYRAARLEQVVEAATEGEALGLQCGEGLLVAQCREVRARSFTDRARFDEATQTYEQARSAYEALGQERGVATSELGLGWVALSRGRSQEALAYIVPALEALRRLGAQSTVATAHNLLGEVHRSLGDKEQAAAHYRRASTLHRACGSQGGATTAQLNLVLVLVEQGDFAEARLRIGELLGPMVTQGREQFLGAGKLIGLVCDAGQGRWVGWSERFVEAEAHVLESGQVHGDLRMLADQAAQLAREQGQEREADQAAAFAQRQREAMDRD